MRRSPKMTKRRVEDLMGNIVRRQRAADRRFFGWVMLCLGSGLVAAWTLHYVLGVL
jgi:hypothetical protein